MGNIEGGHKNMKEYSYLMDLSSDSDTYGSSFSEMSNTECFLNSMY